MLRTIGTLSGVLASGWFGFFVVSNVDMGDVVAYNNIQKHVGSEPFRAGDLVAISPDLATAPSLVCSMDVDSGQLREVALDKTYVNGLGAALPQFAALVDWARGDDPAEALSSNPSFLHFTGRISSFPTSGAMPPVSPDCVCAVAASLLRRAQVCTVERSLIETELVPQRDGAFQKQERTVGVTFRAGNFIIGDFSRLNCPGLDFANTRMEQQTGFCSAGAERSYDVALRHNLGLIREVDWRQQ